MKPFRKGILQTENFLKGDLKTALEETFLKMDELMLEKEGRKEFIQEYKRSKGESAKIKENTKNSQIELLREVTDPKISMFTGCTANALAIKDSKLYFVNAGDSRGVLCKKGTAYPMT